MLTSTKLHYVFIIASVGSLLLVHTCVESGKVLILPGEYSHWHNMRMIVEELAERNHSITVLINSASPSVNTFQSERVYFKIFQVPLVKDEVHAMWNEFVDLWMYQSRTATKIQMMFKTIDVMNRITSHNYVMCDGILRNKMIMDMLKDTKFDVILNDPMMPCGDVLAEALDIPFILSLRLTFGYVFERACGQLPTPPSYVPAVPAQLTDSMDFFERLQNFLMYGFHTALFQLHTRMTTNSYLSEIRGGGSFNDDLIGLCFVSVRVSVNCFILWLMVHDGLPETTDADDVLFGSLLR